MGGVTSRQVSRQDSYRASPCHRADAFAQGLHQKTRRITGLVGSRLSASWCNYRNRLSQYSSRSGFAFQICARLGQVKQILSAATEGIPVGVEIKWHIC
jgi:hypothetical protein